MKIVSENNSVLDLLSTGYSYINSPTTISKYLVFCLVFRLVFCLETTLYESLRIFTHLYASLRRKRRAQSQQPIHILTLTNKT